MPRRREHENSFSRQGHDCDLGIRNEEEIVKFIPGNSLWVKFKRCCVRIRLANKKIYTSHLKSYAAVVREQKRQFYSYPCRLHPFSCFRIWWQIILCFMYAMEIVMGALLLVLLNLDEDFCNGNVCVFIRIMTKSFCFVNIIVNFFTAYYDEEMDEVVFDFKRIAKKYIKTYLVPDIIAILPCRTIQMSKSKLYKFICEFIMVMKILCYFPLYRYLRMICTFFDIAYTKFLAVILLTRVMVYWHSMVCIIGYIRIITGDQIPIFDHSKYQQQVLSNSIPIEDNTTVAGTYVSIWYHGTLILYNSGYGKYPPRNNFEFLIVSMCWYVTKIISIWFLITMMEIMRGKSSSFRKYIQLERQLKQYMAQKQMPTYLRQRILAYFEYKFEKKYFRENLIFNTVSAPLRDEISLHACKKLVENITFFQNLPVHLLVRIISKFHIEIYLPNDVVIKANFPGDSMYVIAAGTVAIYTKRGAEICHLVDGEYFGEISLLKKNTLRTASVVAIEICTMYRLSRQDFVRAIQPYPDLLANIERMAEAREQNTEIEQTQSESDITGSTYKKSIRVSLVG